MKVKVLVAQLCLPLCNLMDCSPPGSSVHGLLQARTLEWVAMPSSKQSSRQGLNPGLCIAGRFFTILATQGSLRIQKWVASLFSRETSQPRNWTGVSCIAGRLFTSWAQIITYLSTITLDVNGINTPIKRRRVDEWIKKKISSFRYFEVFLYSVVFTQIVL